MPDDAKPVDDLVARLRATLEDKCPCDFCEVIGEAADALERVTRERDALKGDHRMSSEPREESMARISNDLEGLDRNALLRTIMERDQRIADLERDIGDQHSVNVQLVEGRDKAEAERDTLASQVASLREALEECEDAGFVMTDDGGHRECPICVRVAQPIDGKVRHDNDCVIGRALASTESVARTPKSESESTAGTARMDADKDGHG